MIWMAFEFLCVSMGFGFFVVLLIRFAIGDESDHILSPNNWHPKVFGLVCICAGMLSLYLRAEWLRIGMEYERSKQYGADRCPDRVVAKQDATHDAGE